MSGPGTNDAMVRNRFLAGRSQAASGIDPEVLQLAEGGGGTQTGAPAVQPSPGAPPPFAGLPLGLRVSNWLSAQGAKTMADHDAQVAAAAKGGMRDAFTGAISGAWDTLKQDFAASHANVSSPEAAAAFQKAPFWDQAKSMFQEQMAAGKLPIDAFNLAISPLSGAVSAATKGIDQGVHKILPFVPSGQVKAALDQSMIAIGPEGGAVSEGAAARELASGTPKAAPAGGAAEGGAAAPKIKTPASGAAGVPGGTSEKPARAFDIAGDEPGADLKITPQLRAKTANFLNGGLYDSPVEVHLDALADDATRNAAVNDIAKIIPLDKVKPIDVTQMGAYSLNLTPDEVMATIRPQFPSDETMYAAGMVLNSSAQEFWKVARIAQETGAPADMEKATRAYALFNKYAGDLRDAKTDWGRAGRIQQEVSSTHGAFAQNISDMIQNVGPDNIDEVIRKTAQLDDPRKVAPFVSSLRSLGGRDGLLYGWYNWLLSNPATVVKKITSDATVAAWNTAVRYAAEKFGSGDVRPGEAAQLMAGYTGSMRDGLAAAAKALKAGHSQFFGDYQSMDGVTHTPFANQAPTAIAADNPTAAAVQWWRSALPTSWIGAADDFAKVVNYRAEVRALSYRDGVIKQLSGEDLSNHVAQMMNNVPQHVHDQAINAALRNTFQEPLTGLAQSLQDTVDKINIPVPGGIDLPLGRVVMPFVKVPANIARFAYRNSALAYALPSDAVKAELRAGGATKDLALARMGMGTAISLIVAPFMLASRITGRGPADPQLNSAWKRAGYQPYSVRVGSTWYNYNKVEPIGMHMAMLADTFDTLKYAHDEDSEQLAWSAAFGVGDAMLSKTYLQGISDFIDALHDPQNEGKYYGDKLVASMGMPQGAAALAQATDPWLRQHYALLDAVQARTPGLAQGLPPVRDLWGQPVAKDQGMAVPFMGHNGSTVSNLLSPVSMAPAGNAQPIDKWIWDNRDAFPAADNGRLGLTRPGEVQSYDRGNVSVPLKLNPQQLDRLRALAGNELKDPQTGMGARDALNALVGGTYPQGGTQRQWDNGSPAARALMVLKIWNRYRDAAKNQVLSENPDMQAALGEKLSSRVQALKAPTLGGN